MCISTPADSARRRSLGGLLGRKPLAGNQSGRLAESTRRGTPKGGMWMPTRAVKPSTPRNAWSVGG